MKKLIYIFIIIVLSIGQSKSKEMVCNFEEVYSDGSIQKGLILIKDKSIRYQYKDKQLFTIIHHNGNTFAVRNDDLSIVQKIDQNQNLIQELFRFFNNETYSNNNFKKDDLSIKAEKSYNMNFYKRLSILEKNLKLSIYFNNCENGEIHIKYFNSNPLEEYSY